MQTIKEVVILYFWSSLLPVLRWPKASHLDSNKWESHPNSAPPILTLHHRVTPATFSSLLVICSYNSEILDLQRSKGWMVGSICLSVSFTFFISVSMIITICHFRNICFIKQYFFFPTVEVYMVSRISFIVHWLQVAASRSNHWRIVAVQWDCKVKSCCFANYHI